jgi:hypothetical protein
VNLPVLPAGEIRRSAPNCAPGRSNGSKPGRFSDRVAVTMTHTDPGANQSIAALENLAIAAAKGQPTGVFVTVARAAFDLEMDDRR